jgi:tetratricopeptide (TPR) repeat protein
MPEIFGGSKVRAITKYEKAISILEKDPAKVNFNWYYLNASIILASRYEATGRTFAAREIYRKLIEFEPLFNFPKEKLLKR